jgi:hypothetical protein
MMLVSRRNSENLFRSEKHHEGNKRHTLRRGMPLLVADKPEGLLALAAPREKEEGFSKPCRLSGSI